MTNTMVRRLAVAAVVAAGTLATFGAGTADAGRTVSPFAGSYTGPQPDAYTQDAWGSISISSDGKIVGSKPPAAYSDERFNGSVADNGAFEIVGSWNPNKARWWVRDAERTSLEKRDATELQGGTIHFVQSSGTIVLGSDGNLYGSTSRGNSFVWLRK